MGLKFSASTNGFYDDTIHTAEQIPADAVDITAERHIELLNGQSDGKVITSNAEGYPILVTPPPPAPPTTEELIAAELVWVDTFPPVHFYSLSDEEKKAMADYRKALVAGTLPPSRPSV